MRILMLFKRIGKIKKLEKWVLHDLNDRQKLLRFEVCSLLFRNQNHPFFDRVLACDEKWMPQDLNGRFKLSRFKMCSSLLLRNQNDPFLDQIVTCDEK